MNFEANVASLVDVEDGAMTVEIVPPILSILNISEQYINMSTIAFDIGNEKAIL